MMPSTRAPSPRIDTVPEEIRWLQTHPTPEAAGDRNRYLVTQARGKSVLHIGAVDSGMLSSRLLEKTFLHSQLTDCSRSCLGVDIDQEGIERLGELGIGNIRYLDVEQLPWQLDAGPFEVVIAADVIEHLTSPGSLLAGARSVMDRESRLILTTPNAYRMENWLLAASGRELIHPQHTLVYSPATLVATLTRHGLAVEKFFVYPTPGKVRFHRGESLSRRAGKAGYALLEFFSALLLRSRANYLADGLGVIAKRND